MSDILESDYQPEPASFLDARCNMTRRDATRVIIGSLLGGLLLGAGGTGFLTEKRKRALAEEANKTIPAEEKNLTEDAIRRARDYASTLSQFQYGELVKKAEDLEFQASKAFLAIAEPNSKNTEAARNLTLDALAHWYVACEKQQQYSHLLSGNFVEAAAKVDLAPVLLGMNKGNTIYITPFYHLKIEGIFPIEGSFGHSLRPLVRKNEYQRGESKLIGTIQTIPVITLAKGNHYGLIGKVSIKSRPIDTSDPDKVARREMDTTYYGPIIDDVIESDVIKTAKAPYFVIPRVPSATPPTMGGGDSIATAINK